MELNKCIKKPDFPLRLQFYAVPPTDDIIYSLETVENLAIERLKVLRCIESVSQDYLKRSREYDEKLSEELAKCSDIGRSFLLTSGSSPSTIASDIERDIVSHYILQLAYCRTEQLSRWFLQHELELFRFRFQLEQRNNRQTITRFVRENRIKLTLVTELERISMLRYFPDDSVIYSAEFAEVCDLISSKRAVLENGKPFFLEEDIYSVISMKFRKNLSHSLSFMRQTYGDLGEEERLMPILAGLHQRYVGKDYSSLSHSEGQERVTADRVEALAKQSFPPCMQRIHDTLSREHHARHWARMQYGLFLKAIGLPMEESIKFWRGKFAPKIDSDQFQKKYAYSIRHSYGQEGKRTNYTAYSCAKIITSNPPAAGDCHGCSFQHTNLALLEQHLKDDLRANPGQIESIVGKAKQKHYQISCRNYFKLVHGLPDDHPIAINHPNEYFEESRKIVTADNK